LAVVIHPDRSAAWVVEIPLAQWAGLAVDRIPLARWVELAVEIPPAQWAGLVVDRIPLARLVALADDATASGCCASRPGHAGKPKVKLN
jgi:hypothetical protein